MRSFSLAALLLLPVATGCGASMHHYHSALGWSLTYPAHWHVEHSRSPSYVRGQVLETTVASFPLVSAVTAHHDSSGASMRVDAPRDPGDLFPATGVAFRVLRQEGGPPILREPRETRFPLRLATFRREEDHSFETPQPLGRSIYVRRQGEGYLVQVWIGPEASRTARTGLARVVSSLSFRR